MCFTSVKPPHLTPGSILNALPVAVSRVRYTTVLSQQKQKSEDTGSRLLPLQGEAARPRQHDHNRKRSLAREAENCKPSSLCLPRREPCRPGSWVHRAAARASLPGLLPRGLLCVSTILSSRSGGGGLGGSSYFVRLKAVLKVCLLELR